MIETKGDNTIIRPTPGKWFTGAAIFLVIGLAIPEASWFFLILALAFAGMASGKLIRLELSPQGIKSQNLWKTRSYRWDDVEDFKIMSIRTSLLSSSKMLAFSRKDKIDTFVGKASRFLGGGTESLPISGIKPDELIASINGYLTRHTMFGQQSQGRSDFGSGAPANAPVPQKTKSAIGFGRPDVNRPSPSAQKASQRPAQTQATPQSATEASKPIFGRQSPSTPVQRSKKESPAPVRSGRPKSDPLVQEGGWLRKRRDSTGF